MWFEGRRLLLGSALLFAGGLPACGSDPAVVSEPEGVLKLHLGYEQPEDAPALAALEAEFLARYPKVVIEHLELPGIGPTDGYLPGSEWSEGDALRPVYVHFQDWLERESNPSGNELLNLNALATRGGWQQAFGDAVRGPVTIDGSLMAVPLEVWRVNTMVYSPAVLAEAGLAGPPTTLDGLVSACGAIAAIGKTCISLDNADWMGMSWLLDGLLPAVAGGAHSRRFLRGELSGDDELFVQTLTVAATLIESSNDDRGQTGLDLAARRVAQGEAAFHPTPDWVRIQLLDEGFAMGADFDLAPHPGASVFVADTMTVWLGTASTSNVPAVEAWLEVVGSEAGQIAYTLPNAPIPARSVADVGGFDPYRQQAIADLANPSIEQVPSHWTTRNWDFYRDARLVLGEFILSGDVPATTAWFSENYERFSSH